MKKKLFFAGMAALLLSFGLLLLACDNGDSDDGPSFDGSTLAGTTWAATWNQPVVEGLSVDMKMTLKFTSDKAGTMEIKVSKWNGTWTDEMKEGYTESEPESFTYTYNATTKKGTSEEMGNFTVDVGKKELTPEDSGEMEVTFKLQ